MHRHRNNHRWTLIYVSHNFRIGTAFFLHVVLQPPVEHYWFCAVCVWRRTSILSCQSIHDYGIKPKYFSVSKIRSWSSCIISPIQDVFRKLLYVECSLAGNVADMSRHVSNDTMCRSNFGQMGPCRRHKIEDFVAVCVGSSQHYLPDFRWGEGWWDRLHFPTGLSKSNDPPGQNRGKHDNQT